ncbi:MAG: nicotinamide mononucleotide transporter [Clostridia bacterium]|nr:nicotinamide mononucleotide transporter [Clostridia bacterium]
MTKAKNWILNEFWIGYTLFEKLFMLSMLAVQIIVYCVAPDTVLGIIAGISGVISVVLCAKGKISFYFIGFVQTITYLFLAWENRFYGEVLENVFYLVTMVWGIFIWKKNMNRNDDGSTEVAAKKFSLLQWIAAIVGTLAATVAMGFALDKIGSAQAYTDAATNVMAIFAQLLMVRRYREQWIWWLVIDILCVKMWFVAGNWSMVAMYIGWIANCIYGWVNWTRLEKKAKLASSAAEGL